MNRGNTTQEDVWGALKEQIKVELDQKRRDIKKSR